MDYGKFNTSEEEVNNHLWAIEIEKGLTNSELLFSNYVEPEVKEYAFYDVEEKLNEAYSEADRAYNMEEEEHPTFHGDNEAYEESLDEYHDSATSIRSEIESISNTLYGIDSSLAYDLNEIGEDVHALLTWLEEKEDLLKRDLAYYLNEYGLRNSDRDLYTKIMDDAKAYVDPEKRHRLEDEFDRLLKVFADQMTYINRYARELSDHPTDPSNTTAYTLLGCEGIAEEMANITAEMRLLGREYDRRMRAYGYVIDRDTGFDFVRNFK